MDIQDAIRDEMRGVLSEMAAGKHRNTAEAGAQQQQLHGAIAAATAASSGWGHSTPSRLVAGAGGSGAPAAGDEAGKLQHLRERVAILEDALAKSEADRAAIYARCEQVERALAAANDEKLALLHEYHDASHGSVNDVTAMLQQARADNERLRVSLEEVPRLKEANRELEREAKKLRKLKERALDERAEGVTLSDLHFSNERLSAQLAKLQSPPQAPVFDEGKYRECESAIMAIANDVAQFETRVAHIQQVHALERQQLQDALDRQFHEFSIERAECDRVVGIMSAKLEALVSENTMLKKSAAATVAPQGTTPGMYHTPSSVGRSAARR